jgi:serine/threonine protein kinase
MRSVYSKFNTQQEDNEVPNKLVIVANRYIIENKIGKGSFGEVFKGYDVDTREPVAIKVVLITNINSYL